jgi:hypothetical protein
LFIIEQKRSIQRRIWARKETQIYWEIYFSRGEKKSIGSYILAGTKQQFYDRRIQQGTKEDSLLKDLSGNVRKSTDTYTAAGNKQISLVKEYRTEKDKRVYMQPHFRRNERHLQFRSTPTDSS